MLCKILQKCVMLLMKLVRILSQNGSADKASLPVSFITLEISKNRPEVSSSNKYTF